TDLTSTFIVPSAPLAFFSTDTAPPDIYTLSLHDALPICNRGVRLSRGGLSAAAQTAEQVQLPHRAQTCIVDRLVTVETGQGAGALAYRALQGIVDSGRLAVDIESWQELRTGLRGRCPSLLDS